MRLLRLFHRRNLAACLFGLVLAASWKFGIAILSAGPNVPRLEIARREVDLGQVAAGHAIPVEFPVRNAGSARLIVRSTACPCENAAIEDVSLQPGESGTIRVPFQTPRETGPSSRDFAFLSNDPAAPEFVLKVHADVCPDR